MKYFNEPLVFINYRRQDTSIVSRALKNDLDYRFGKGVAFLDLDDIAPGQKWSSVLTNKGIQIKILLVVIGNKWLIKDLNGNIKLFKPDDWVRKEIEIGLKEGKTIIPVLFETSDLPSIDVIPNSIKDLLSFQWIEIRNNKWNDDIKILESEISNICNIRPINQKRLNLLRWLGLVTVLALFTLSVFSVYKEYQENKYNKLSYIYNFPKNFQNNNEILWGQLNGKNYTHEQIIKKLLLTGVDVHKIDIRLIEELIESNHINNQNKDKENRYKHYHKYAILRELKIKIINPEIYN